LGTLASCALLLAGAAAAAARVDEPARLLATLGVVALLATPAFGLIATALELRSDQPRSAALALVVLAVLAVAAGIAVISR
jgi:hypothetical protein